MPLLSKDVRALRAGDVVRIDSSARRVLRTRAVAMPARDGGATLLPAVEIMHQLANGAPGVGYFTAPEGAQVFTVIP